MSSIAQAITPAPAPNPRKATEASNVLFGTFARVLAQFTGLIGIEAYLRPRMQPGPDAPANVKQYGSNVTKLERDGKTVYLVTASGGTVPDMLKGMADAAARLYSAHVALSTGRISEITRKKAEQAIAAGINPGLQEVLAAFLKDYQKRDSGVKGFVLFTPAGEHVTINFSTKGNAQSLVESALIAGCKLVSKEQAVAVEKANDLKRDLRESPAYLEMVAKAIAELQAESQNVNVSETN